MKNFKINIFLKKSFVCLFFLLTAIALFSYDAYYDLSVDKNEILNQRNAQKLEMKERGIKTPGAYKAVDTKYRNEAKTFESKREKALKEIFDKAGLPWPPKYTGTPPGSEDGRGIMGDIDTENMPKKDIDKLVETVKIMNEQSKAKGGPTYEIKNKTGYVQIEGLDFTGFKTIKNAEKIPHLRAKDKETVLAYKVDDDGNLVMKETVELQSDGTTKIVKKPVITDQHIYNLDNVKKMGSELSKNPSDMDWQSTGKGTARILENTYGKDLKGIKDPAKKAEVQALLDKCNELKTGSLEGAKVYTDEDVRKLKDQIKSEVNDALKTTGQNETRMTEKRDAAWAEIEKAKKELKASKGKDPELKEKLKQAQNTYNETSKDLSEFRNKKLAAERGIINNDAGEILAESKGQKVQKVTDADGKVKYRTASGEELTPSSLKEKITRNTKQRALNSVDVIDVDGMSNRFRRPNSLGKAPITPPSIINSPNFADGVNIADNMVTGYQLYEASDSFLPTDIDPKTRKGMRVLIGVVGSTGTPGAIMGGAVAGGQAGFDELVEWYKKNPGKEPTNLESLGIGMRGANKFTKDMAVGVVYGFTKKPLDDVASIYTSGRDAYQAYKESEAIVKLNKDIQKEQRDIKEDSLFTMEDFLDDTESAVKEILKYHDITPEEKTLSNKILERIDFTRGHIKISLIDTEGRLGSVEDRLLSYRTALNSTTETEKLFKQLLNSIDKCTLALRIVDLKSGKDITKEGWISLVGSNYKAQSRDLKNGAIVFSGIPSGEYLLKVNASGHKGKEDQQIALDIEKKRNYTGTVTLDVLVEEVIDYTAKVSEETKKIDEDTKKIAANVKDSELEKAKDVLHEINSISTEGVILSQKAALESKLSRIAWRVSEYAGVKVSDGATLFMASGTANIQPFMRSGAVLCAANMLYTSAWFLNDGRVDVDEIALMYKALKDPNDASGTIDAAYALGLTKFFIYYMGNQTFNVSNITWYKAYKEYQDSRQTVSQGDKKAKKRDAEYYLGVMSKGGYDAVSAELDMIWNEDKKKTLGISDDKNFDSENPFIEADYRNKYILQSIAPLIFDYAKNNKLEKEKVVAVALRDFSAVLNACTINIRGSIECGPETVPMKLLLSSGKKKLEKSGAGSFSFSINLKELTQYSLDIKIENKYPENMVWYLGSSGRSGFISLALLPYHGRVFYELKVSGSNIDIKVDPYYLYAIKKIPYLKKLDNYDTRCPVPKSVESPDKVNKALSEASQAVSSIDKAGYDKASYLYYCKEGEAKMYLLNFNDSYYNMQRALSHNCDVEIKLAGSDYEKSKAIRNRYKPQIDKLEEERKKVDKNVTDTLAKLYKDKESKSKEFVKQEQSYTKENESLWKSNSPSEFYKKEKEFDELFGKYFSQMELIHKSRDENRDYSSGNLNPEFIYAKFLEEAISSFSSKSAEISSLQVLMTSFSSKWKSCYDNAFKLAADTQNVKMKIGGPKYFDVSGFKAFNSPWIYHISDYWKWYLTSSLISKINLSRFISENTRRADWYMEKRGLGSKNIDTILDEAEKLANQLPNEGKLSEANAEIGPVADEVDGYSWAITRAVMLGEKKNMKIPSGVLDRNGSDDSFVRECSGILGRLMSNFKGVIGNMLPRSMAMDTPYTKLQDLMRNIPYNEMNEEQRKRYKAVQDKIMPIQMAHTKYPNLLKVYSLAIAGSLDDTGNTPEERVENLIEKNNKVVDHMDELESKASSINSVDEAQKYIKEANDWYGMMPDVPTVEAIKQRGMLFEKIVKTGVFEKNRQANGLPPAPKSISISGKDVPYDGRCVVYKYSQLPAISADMAKSYENTEWKGKMTKALFYRLPKDNNYKLEYSMWNGENGFMGYVDTGKDNEMPIAKDYLPLQYNILVRNVSDSDGKPSRVKYEPGITILILP